MQQHIEGDFLVPLDVAGAWRNGPALATLLITFAVVAMTGLLVVASDTSVAWPIAAILCSVLAALGVSAAASQFAEQAAGRPVPSVARAFAAAPGIVLGSFLLAGVLLGVFAAFVLLAAAVLFVCRLPVVGSILLVISLPALAIIGAALLAVLVGAAMLALPALWEGHSLRTALSQAYAVAAQRKGYAFGQLARHLLTAVLVIVSASAFVFAAFALIALLAVPLSGAMRIDGVFAGLWGGPLAVDQGAMALAAPVVVALLTGITIALSVAVLLFGLALAYRRCTEGIDIAVARVAVARAIVELQVRKGETAEALARFARRLGGRRAIGAAGGVEFQVQEAAVAAIPFAPAAASPLACAHCACSAQPHDVYCGNCGQRLSPPLVA